MPKTNAEYVREYRKRQKEKGEIDSSRKFHNEDMRLYRRLKKIGPIEGG